MLPGMSDDGPREPAAIDVDALMADLRERIDQKKAAGLYAVDDLAADLRATDDPWDGAQFERALVTSQVMPGLITSESDSALVGRALTRVKEQIVRATWRNTADLADQLNAFHLEMTAYAGSLGAEVRRLRREVDEFRAGQDGGGLAALERRIDRLGERLASPDAADIDLDLAQLTESADPGLGPLLARELSGEGGADGCLIGAGRGELLDALGPGFSGIDDRTPLAAAGRAAGRAVAAADPLAHLESLPDGALPRIVIRELAESKPLAYTASALRQCARVLARGGILAVVVRNHRSPAERDAFWDDPWRLRPVEPETVSALLVAAGFGAPDRVWVGDEGSSADAERRTTARCAVILARRP